MNRFPSSNDETGNVVVRTVGTPRSFDFEIKDHVDVGAALGLEFDVATKLGWFSRFAVEGAESRACTDALAQFMLDTFKPWSMVIPRTLHPHGER